MALLAAGCGGAGGGPGPAGAGQDLELVVFLQAGLDTVPLNRVLEFHFSEPLDPDSVGPASLQIREGPSFGRSVAGTFLVDQEVVRFEPVLPTSCREASRGLKPGTTYRVSIVGAPETFSVRNTSGQALVGTRTAEFRTLREGSDGVLEDQRPDEFPRVIATTPSRGASAVSVGADDEIEIRLSENVNPCAVVEGVTVRVLVSELGDLDTFAPAGNGNDSGFVPVEDAEPEDAFTWGGNGTSLAPAVRLASSVEIVQDFAETLLRIRPLSGRFPENSLIVVECTAGLEDFGGSPMLLEAFSFTTENLPAREERLEVRYDGSTPIDVANTTADVDTARSPARAQGWLSFGGDGDNGPVPHDIPSWPVLDELDHSFLDCNFRTNDGERDPFEPTADVTLHTGSTVIDDTCRNGSDGSTAVTWEFSSFRVAAGVTVTLAGVNPAIILVSGDVIIEPGGAVMLRGTDGADAVRSTSSGVNATTGGTRGGTAVAGGGDGGRGFAEGTASGQPSGDAGFAGYGSVDAYLAGGVGAGDGGTAQKGSTNTFSNPTSYGGAGQGGGGGAHSSNGVTGTALAPINMYGWSDAVAGAGGDTYPAGDTMRTPSAGSGGGGGGWARNPAGTIGRSRYDSEGGGGGAGGGFLGLVASGSITVQGVIDASGGDGGRGGTGWYVAGGGGGGGAGGGIRLLTPGAIDLSGGTLLAAGGSGGQGLRQIRSGSGFAAGNDGGKGANGRIVLEDGDSVVAGLATAVVVPGEGEDGFARGVFDPSRFVGGANESKATTHPVIIGPILRPSLVSFPPLAGDDFLAGIPTRAALPSGQASIVVELQGFLAGPDGELDESSGTGWFVVGYFERSGSESAPLWIPDAAPAGFTPEGGIGVGNLDGRTVYVQVRLRFELPDGLVPADPGPFVESLRLRFTSDT